MARIARLVVKEGEAIYHVMSRTALDGFVLGDVEKDEFLKIVKHLSSVFFCEVMGFCIMGNHFHLLVKMKPSGGYSDQEIRRRFKLYYKKDTKRKLTEGQIPYFRDKWSSLSEYAKEIKQSFSRYYNRKNGRRGFFWSDRFKSVLVENGDTLINTTATLCHSEEERRRISCSMQSLAIQGRESSLPMVPQNDRFQQSVAVVLIAWDILILTLCGLEW